MDTVGKDTAGKDTVGDLIRSAREHTQSTRESVASFIGISVDELAQIEAGTRALEADELFGIAAALGVDTLQLLTGSS